MGTSSSSPLAGIYAITNTLNGKQYIGQSQDIQYRWWQHRSILRRGNHHSHHLQRAWNKYGEAVFMFTILEQVDELSRLDAAEQHYLDLLKPAYNICLQASSTRGIKHTAEARFHVSTGTSEGMKRVHKSRTAAQREAINAKISASHKGVKLSREHVRAAVDGRRKASLAAGKAPRIRNTRQEAARLRWKNRTPEQLAAISAKISAATKGKPKPRKARTNLVV